MVPLQPDFEVGIEHVLEAEVHDPDMYRIFLMMQTLRFELLQPPLVKYGDLLANIPPESLDSGIRYRSVLHEAARIGICLSVQ